MTKIYEQHDAAFGRVSSYAVLLDGKAVAKVAIKYPADGAGRLYAYAHWMGTEMVRGSASGMGYDKRSAALANAVSKQDVTIRATPAERRFFEALEVDGGSTWDRELERAGFVVFQTV